MISIEKDPIIGLARERFQKWGVKGVLLDLDDTLIYTSEIFRFWMAEYVEQISSQTGIAKYVVAKDLSEINDREYVKSGVSPKRWDAVVLELSKKYSRDSELILSSLRIRSNSLNVSVFIWE